MHSGTDETLLEMAREWAREQDPAFHRFFDISTEDTAWLKAATDRDIRRLSQLPASAFRVVLLHREDGNAERHLLNTKSVVQVVGVLGEIREGLSDRKMETQIYWNLKDSDADWLLTASPTQRRQIAALGRIQFVVRDGHLRQRVEPYPEPVLHRFMRLLHA